MSFTTLEQYYRDYRVKNGQVPSEVVLNKGPMRLKREIRELKALSDLAIGNDLPTWSAFVRYEADEYVSYNGKNYKSLSDGNVNYQPDKNTTFWEVITINSLKNIASSMRESHNHDDRYYTEDELNAKFAVIDAHNHDDRYYTESEMDSKLANKSDVGHTHDDRYYTESEMDSKLANKSDVGHTHTLSDITDANNIFPAGLVIFLGTTKTPTGFLPCNGAEVSRTDYPRLFNAIGTTFGEGDSSTTFNIPNLNDGKFIRASKGIGAINEAGAPNITGTLNGIDTKYFTSSGCFEETSSAEYHVGGSSLTTYNKNVNFDASLSSSVYGKSNTIMPYSINLMAFIKY